jgi:sugar lactone lactonase YvrE
LGDLQGIAIDAAGDLYISDCDNHLIFKLERSSGSLSILGGNGVGGFSADGPAKGLKLNCPEDLMFHQASGDLYFIESSRIRKITPDGSLITVAGGGSSSADGTRALQLATQPRGLALDASGNIFFTEYNTSRVRKIGADGIVTSVAGSDRGFGGDGGPALEAKLAGPDGLAVASDGTIYIGDYDNNRIRAVDPAGNIRTVVAGQTAFGTGVFSLPLSLHLEKSGGLLVVDPTNAVFRVSAGTITLVAGGKYGYTGDNGPANQASFLWPRAVVSDDLGNLFITDSGNRRIRRVDPNGIVTTYAGNGNNRRSPDLSNPLSAWLQAPKGVTISPQGLLTFSDYLDYGVVRQVTANGQLQRIAGSLAGRGDQSEALTAYLSDIRQISYDPAGNLYAAVRAVCNVQKITPSGRVEVVTGNCDRTTDVDNGPATSAIVGAPEGVWVDPAGSINVTASAASLSTATSRR